MSSTKGAGAGHQDASTGRRGRIRSIGAGLIDQAVIAGANAGNTLLALALLPRDRAGLMLLSVGLTYVVLGINRAFVGDILLALGSRYDGQRRERFVRHGTATATVVGLLFAVLFLVLGLAWPRGGNIDLRDLVTIAGFLPFILLHDAGRYSYLAARTPAKALVIDLVWVGTQALAILVFTLGWGPSAAALMIAWGLGATAGATVFLVRTAAYPWAGSPRQWLAQTRQLAGWFTATALVGQFHTQAVGFLVAGWLSPAATAGLRAAQVAVLQPVQNFTLAVQGLLVPRLSRLAGRAMDARVDATELAGAPAGTPDARPDPVGAAAVAAAELHRTTLKVAGAFVLLAAALVAVLWPVAHLVIVRIPKYQDIAPLALPISMQAGIYLIQVPFTAALRGMHRARALFVQYVVFVTISLTGLAIGAQRGLTEAVWGLLIGSATGLAVMITQYARSIRQLRSSSTDARGSDPGRDAAPPTAGTRPG